jgi:hypothetical protein
LERHPKPDWADDQGQPIDGFTHLSGSPQLSAPLTLNCSMLLQMVTDVIRDLTNIGSIVVAYIAETWPSVKIHRSRIINRIAVQLHFGETSTRQMKG